MDSQQLYTGFPGHIQNQLHQAAQQVSDRARGTGRGRFRSREHVQTQHHGYADPRMVPHYNSADPAAFPPLGTRNMRATQVIDHPQVQQYSVQPSFHPGYQPSHEPRDFFDRARGYHRGGRNHRNHARGHYSGNRSNDRFTGSHHYTHNPNHSRVLYQPNSGPHMATAEQQRELRQRIIIQSDYLNSIQQEACNRYQLKSTEKQLKESFRKLLEAHFQKTLLSTYADINVSEIRLKCYGSLNNGFGLAGCDMDLMLLLPEQLSIKNDTVSKPSTVNAIPITENATDASTVVKTGQESQLAAEINNANADNVTTSDETATTVRVKVGRLLEAVLLENGYGARLLTNTRVPILKVCETPSEDLLQNLKENRKHEDEARTRRSSTSISNFDLPPVWMLSQIQAALEVLEDQSAAAEIPVPDAAEREGVSLEFSGDCGIQCDVNFSNQVAMHNTRLLREYCKYDERVALIGVFVKVWAKVRDINTPYWGTLSSYGYVLMVLHYLMNVASPPVIPNLQQLAQDEAGWHNTNSVDFFEGKYDVRFWNDEAKIASFRASVPRNHESVGKLLRGFFAYYAEPDGFRWNQEVISIRSRSGVLTKRSKGWTEAKWTGKDQNKNIRLRYLLAIEDPFETDHNVGRTVGHNGIVAIRDEFRRAWRLIQNIGSNEPVEDLLQRIDNRGDMLRKDQEFHRQKMKQMKQDLEAKELALRQQIVAEPDVLHEQRGLKKADAESTTTSK